MFESTLGPDCRMWTFFAFFMRGFRWLWGRKRSEYELRTPLASFPEYEFRPTALFSQHVGQDASFVVVNSFDILLQEQGLMADALVVEVSQPNCATRVLWLRYNVKDLRDVGVSLCTLLADGVDGVFEGACGTLSDRKRI